MAGTLAENNGHGTTSSRSAIAFLGPEGTYGQQAARQFARSLKTNEELEWIPCRTITHAYEYPAKYTVLPLENTIFGPVTETLDCLFKRLHTPPPNGDRLDGSSRAPANGKGKEKEIIATLDLPIRHCLVVKRGTRMGDIKWVRSHEQALGQSGRFLNQHLPNAKRIPTASTALAARSLLNDPEAGGALCSASVVEGNDGLEILYEGTQDREGNFTRFILLADSSKSSSAATPDTDRSQFYLLRSPDGLRNLPDFESSRIGSLHSRPVSTSSDQRTDSRYPCNTFVELIGASPASTTSEDREGNESYVYLGSASVTTTIGHV